MKHTYLDALFNVTSLLNFDGWAVGEDGETLDNVFLYNDVDQAIKDANVLAQNFVEFKFTVDTEGPLNCAKIVVLNPMSSIILAQLEKTA